MVYVEDLQELCIANDNLKQMSSAFLASVPADYRWMEPSLGAINYGKEASRTRKTETSRRQAQERYEAVLLEVEKLEVEMGITKHWEVTDAEYIKTAQYMSQRQYHRALENLQCLVVQRLFELHKLNLQHTGG